VRTGRGAALLERNTVKVHVVFRGEAGRKEEVEIVEMPCLPCEGERFETRDGHVMQVLQVTHTPFNPDSSARILVGIRNSLGPT
jgi:hypothetical protein